MLFAYQKRVYQDPSPVVHFVKSRRIGGSFLMAIKAFDLASLPLSAGGMNVVYACHRHDTARDFIADVATYAREVNRKCKGRLIRDPRQGKDIQTYGVRCTYSGFTVEAVSSKPDNLRGKGRRRCAIILDEFAHQQNAQQAYKAAAAVLLRKGRVYTVSTHFGEDTYFNKLVSQAKAGRVGHSWHEVTLLDAIRDGYYRQVCEMVGEEWTQRGEDEYVQSALSEEGAEEEYLCVPAALGTNYFSRKLVESCMYDEGHVARLELSHDFTFKPEVERKRYVEQWLERELFPRMGHHYTGFEAFIGWDFAHSARGDLSVMAIGRISQRMCREIPVVLEMRGVPFDQQWQIYQALRKRLKTFLGVAIDGGGNGSYLAQKLVQDYSEAEAHVVHVNNNVYKEMLPALKAGMETGLVAYPRDASLLADMMQVIRKEGAPLIPRMDDGLGTRHADFTIALMLAYHIAKPQAEIDFDLVTGYVDARKKMLY